MNFYIYSLLFLFFEYSYCQFTGITLNTTNTILKDTQLGNSDLAQITLQPPTTAATCNIKDVVATATNTPVPHPFNVRYQISTGIDWFVIFDSTSPNKLDFSTVPLYTITVECFGDNVNHSDSLTVQILPNQIPAIIDYPTAVRSFSAVTVPGDRLLYKVTATDGDGDPLTYTYNIDPPGAASYIYIDPVTNEIRAAVDFRSVTITPFTVTVDVTDGFDTVSGFKLRIQITNLNTRPVITNLPDVIIMKENVNGGTLVKDLIFDDPDFGGSFTPTCTVFPNLTPSIITVSGNRIQLANGPGGKSYLNFESVSSYQITCTITDGYLTSLNDVLTLNVENINEPPQFNKTIYNCQLYESKAGESTCSLFLNVFDPENDLYTISIRPGINSQRFTFASPSSDILSFAVDYDVDNNAMPSSVLVDIEARDDNGGVGLAQVQVTVTDVNDNSPVFTISPGLIEINDLTLIGRFV